MAGKTGKSTPLAPAAPKLRGGIDVAKRDRIRGWAHDPATPDTPVSLLIIVNGRLVSRVLANRYRADLEKSGIGDGRRAWEFPLVPPLSPLVAQVIEVRRERDGVHLPGSPRALEAEKTFGADAQAWMSKLLGSADSDQAIVERLEYLTRETELLLQRRADLRGHRVERRLRRQTELRWDTKPGGAAAANGAGLLRALVIDEKLPTSNNDAGSNAIRSHMKALRRLGYEVSIAGADMTPNSAGLDVDDIVCCQAPWYASVEEVLRRQAGCFDLVYLHRLSSAMRYTALVRHHQPRARIVYSVADLHFLRLGRQAKVEQRPELTSFADRMQVMELIAIGMVDGVITHSSYEAELLRRQVPKARVHVVPWAIPARPTTIPFEKRRGMAFIANYRHAPNLDAAQRLVDEIVPALLALAPDFECLLVGSAMPDSLRKKRPGIVALGQVEDIMSIFDRVRLTVAPMVYGAGIKGKVLDSIAAGVPCACTTIAAEGLELPDVLLQQVGDTNDDLVAAIRRMHDDADLNQMVRAAGLAYVEEQLSESRIDSLMRGAIGLQASTPSP